MIRGVLFLVAVFGAEALAATPDAAAPASWSDWAQGQSDASPGPVVQERQITKSGRLQVVGPLVGLSDRRDFYTTYVLSLGARYHFDERSAWEFVHVDYSYAKRSELATEIQEQTSFRPDVQLSRFQVGSSYVYTPIYGKYAWNSDSLVYFDVFGSVGAGLRFAEDTQPFGELGLGMNHYVFGGRGAIVPEVRWRFYSEQRTSSTFVSEGMLQVGTSWLF